MIKNTFPGKFIVIEGIDGAGKSTQAAIVASNLYKTGAIIYLTSEPTHFLTGGLIHARLLDEWQSSPECLQLLFAADRAQHLEKEIILWLKEGISVVSDRYFLSSLAYGAVDCDLGWLMNINSRFLMPDLTIFLDVDAKTAAQRIAANGRSIELFEKEEILETVRKNYQKAVDSFKYEMVVEMIDGNRNKEEVSKDIESAIIKILPIK